jgi:uncharacterized protein YjbI with pentapeptide repeats
LAQKLHRFTTVLDTLPDETVREDQQACLFPFPFSLMLIGRPAQWRLRGLLGLMVGATVVLLPLILLLWAQLRFLPYHDTAITWNHRAAVLVDLALLWLFWTLLLPPVYRTAAVAPSRRLWRVVPRPASVRCLRWGTGLVCLTLGTVVFSLGLTIPKENIEVWMASHLPGVLVHTYLARTAPDPFMLSNLTYTDMSVFELTFWLFERPGALFHRNLQLQGQVLVDGDPSAEVRAALDSRDGQERAQGLKKLTGLMLTNRDLRGANLRNTLFPKADLRGANLEGADLSGARVFAGNLSLFEISQSRRCVGEASVLTTLCATKLQGANLTVAQLQEANLTMAQLQEANLANAGLEGANLANAGLQGADLVSAQLQGANLERAQLQGANLWVARLQGANLVRAQLQGANLQGARLQGATLVSAQLQGANLHGASVGSANFSGANLTWSDLRGLDQSPLDYKEYWELEKTLTDAIRDIRAREASLKRLQDAIRRPTNLSALVALERSVLCDDVTMFRFCVPPEQSAEYANSRTRFLVDLGCEGKDAAIARGIIGWHRYALRPAEQKDPILMVFAKHITTSPMAKCPWWATALSADANEKVSLRSLAVEETPVPK